MLKKLATCALLSPLALNSLPAEADRGFTFPPSFLAWEDYGRNPFQYGPEAELVKTKEGYRIKMIMSGFDKKDIKIHFDDKNVLNISADHKESQEKDEEVMYSSMNAERKVRQAFQLSNDIDPNTIKASFNNGILIITMKADPKKADPKKAEAKHIQIN